MCISTGQRCLRLFPVKFRKLLEENTEEIIQMWSKYIQPMINSQCPGRRPELSWPSKSKIPWKIWKIPMKTKWTQSNSFKNKFLWTTAKSNNCLNKVEVPSNKPNKPLWKEAGLQPKVVCLFGKKKNNLKIHRLRHLPSARKLSSMSSISKPLANWKNHKVESTSRLVAKKRKVMVRLACRLILCCLSKNKFLLWLQLSPKIRLVDWL